ncbi:helix-turn-helix domain-containing protein [Paenibacillus sp. sptzw28]|uniref:helix-turn-helix domain-containing protein n=1 Tax=Paenibacillus sp. sptzw28 TaxID=715179 RepID=UPI001C6F02CE|nr:helix-turn-helix domain-containing protein [Paenibacillus sp. sptzw28]QYR21460.1 helix-turn-helix domain-containing protein [Paenibacillus sp. sptzw28]
MDMLDKRLNLLTLQEAMDLLEVSRSTLDRWRKQQRMPFVKIGKEIYFHKEDVQLWIRSHSRILDPAAQRAGQEPCNETITIGYQSGTAHMWSALIVKEMRLFEEEIAAAEPSRPYTVRWHDAANGLELVEGMIAGSIQLASLGDYPIIVSLQLAQMLPNFRPVLLAFDGKTTCSKGISIVVPRGSSIRTSTDLSDQTISTVVNSSAGHRLKRLLTSLETQHIHIIHREMNDSLDSITLQHVGASAMWEPYVSLARLQGAESIYFDQEWNDDYLTGLVAQDRWMQANDWAVTAYLKAHLRAHQVMRCFPVKAAKIISRSTGFPLEMVANLCSEVRWDAAAYTKDLKTLCNLAENNVTSTLNFRGDYLEEAAKQLKLPSLLNKPMEGNWSFSLLY